MRKKLIILTGKLFILLLLMSGFNFSRHYCLPELSPVVNSDFTECCGSDCSSVEYGEQANGQTDDSCCKLVESFLYIPVYSVYRLPSPEPVILTLTLHCMETFCLTLEGQEVSFPRELALQGEPPGPDITLLRVFRI